MEGALFEVQSYRRLCYIACETGPLHETLSHNLAATISAPPSTPQLLSLCLVIVLASPCGGIRCVQGFAVGGCSGGDRRDWWGAASGWGARSGVCVGPVKVRSGARVRVVVCVCIYIYVLYIYIYIYIYIICLV